jgi:N-methylhydantoinase B/oxoprolinase/acetone carboxylase alpha subunit
VFAEQMLLGFAVNRAHHIDIGGMAVAGFPGTAHSIYQEGLRIPPVRWFSAGQENRDVIEMITLNMRFPRDQFGDFQAQLSSTHTAERRLLRLAEKYGADVVLACMEETKRHSEELMRAVIRELPDGSYSFTELMDDDGVTDQPYKIAVVVTINGDNVVVDYTGTSPQATGPINSSYGNTLSSTFNAMLQLMGPDVPFNEGCFRPVSVIAPRGCLLNPVPPAPCFGGVTEVSIRIIDAILGAIAPVAPKRVGASSYGTCINFSGGGFDPERDQTFGFYFFVEGGWGASAWRDGWNTTPNPTSNFNDYPVEWIEATLPLRYKEVRINTDSGGAGRYRGGVGVVRTFEVMTDDVEINALGDRFLIPPFGLDGGNPGGCSALLMKSSATGNWQTIQEAFGTKSPSKFHGTKANHGVWFSIISGGGGGFGNPAERPPQAVVRDAENGYVSRDGARRDYGVAVVEAADGSLTYDPAETARFRIAMAGCEPEAVLRYEQLMRNTIRRAAAGQLRAQTKSEAAAVTRLIEQARTRLSEARISDPSRPSGRSLKSPFLNDRAMQYWDSDALHRWMSRHHFSLR